MGLGFELTEPVAANPPVDGQFGVGRDGARLHQILRLLTGSLTVTEQKTGREYRLAENLLRTHSLRSGNPDRLRKIAFGNDVELDDYRRILTAQNAANYAFYDRVLQELIICLVARKRHRYTEAFLYFYRILEHICLSIPLIYAISQSNFKTTYDFLKSLMDSDKDGDLKILRSSLPVIFAGNDVLSLQFEFSISGMSLEYVSELKKQMEIIVPSQGLRIELEEDGDTLFRVDFVSMVSVAAIFRNRMFHYQPKKANFELGKIGGAEDISRMLLNELLYWFSLLFFELIRVAAARDGR